MLFIVETKHKILKKKHKRNFSACLIIFFFLSYSVFFFCAQDGFTSFYLSIFCLGNPIFVLLYADVVKHIEYIFKWNEQFQSTDNNIYFWLLLFVVY